MGWRIIRAPRAISAARQYLAQRKSLGTLISKVPLRSRPPKPVPPKGYDYVWEQREKFSDNKPYPDKKRDEINR